MSQDGPENPDAPATPPPKAPDAPPAQESGSRPPSSRFRLLDFKGAKDEEPSPEGILVPSKRLTAADSIAPLKQALASAQAGHVVASAIILVMVDGSEGFFVAGNDTTWAELLGCLEIVRGAIVDRALPDYKVKG